MKRSFRFALRKILAVTLALTILFTGTVWASLAGLGAGSAASAGQNLVFLHHSVGYNWLNHSLRNTLLAKLYIDQQNDIYYGSVLEPDAGRPASLGDVPGDLMNMNHWILWFNDYFQGIQNQTPSGSNHIILFKSCFFSSNVSGDGTEPGNPFSSQKTLVNYKAVYRHPDGPGHTYLYNNTTYQPLEDIFAANPDILFIPITAPPLNFGPVPVTSDEWAHRARLFNNWLKNEWLPAYNAAHPGLNNVAVFDFFDVLAYPDDHDEHPNRLREEYGGNSGDPHPNSAGNAAATAAFATAPNNFLDQAWQRFTMTNSYRRYVPLAIYLPVAPPNRCPCWFEDGVSP